jgi:succinate dehydrogenase / fumarate reductase membrane anchor subunit
MVGVSGEYNYNWFTWGDNMVKKNITGAGYGFNSWLQQRVAAVIMLVFALAFLVFIFYAAFSLNSSFSSWQNLFSYKSTKIIVQIFFIALLWHAWVGVRDIWMDYIQCATRKLILHTLTLLWLVASLIYSVSVIWY